MDPNETNPRYHDDAYRDATAAKETRRALDALREAAKRILTNEVLPQYVSGHWPVYAIGLQGTKREVDIPLLQDIAAVTGGAAFQAGEGVDLLRVYSQILSELGKKSLEFLPLSPSRPGEVATQPIAVDTHVRGLEIAVSGPRGAATPQVAIADPSNRDVTHTTDKREGAGYQVFSVPQPVAGEWKLHVAGAGAGVSAGVYRDLSFALFVDPLDPTYRVGEPIPIRASIVNKDAGSTVDDQSILARTTLEAEFTFPDRSKAHLVLFNDGTHGDGGYLDAVWGNTFRDARQEGIYEMALAGEVAFDSGLVHLGPITRALKVVAPTNIRLVVDDSMLHKQHRARLTVARLRNDESVEADPRLLNKARFFVEVIDPGGIRESLSAFDDGKPEHGDRTADDGEYSVFLQPGRDGEYRLVGVFETVAAQPGEPSRETARSAVASLLVAGIEAPGLEDALVRWSEAIQAFLRALIDAGRGIVSFLVVHLGWVATIVGVSLIVATWGRYAARLRAQWRALRTQARQYEQLPVAELRRELAFERTPDGKVRPPIQLGEGGESEFVELPPGHSIEVLVRPRSTSVRLRGGGMATVNGQPLSELDGETQLAPETVLEIGDYVLRYREERVDDAL